MKDIFSGNNATTTAAAAAYGLAQYEQANKRQAKHYAANKPDDVSIRQSFGKKRHHLRLSLVVEKPLIFFSIS